MEGLRAAARKAREDGNLALAEALDVTRFEVYQRYLDEELPPTRQTEPVIQAADHFPTGMRVSEVD